MGADFISISILCALEFQIYAGKGGHRRMYCRYEVDLVPEMRADCSVIFWIAARC